MQGRAGLSHYSQSVTADDAGSVERKIGSYCDDAYTGLIRIGQVEMLPV